MGELERWCIMHEITGERLDRARYIDANGSTFVSKEDRELLNDLIKELYGE